MSHTRQHADQAAGNTERLGKYLVVYVVILIIAGLQFVLAYQQLDAPAKLLRMLPLAFLEGALAGVFFMHLGSENRAFVISVVIISLFVFAALQYGWTDSYRMEKLAVPSSSAGVPQ